MTEIALRMTGIDKSFAGTHALAGVDLTVHTGTVHAIVGENGAGKKVDARVPMDMPVVDNTDVDTLTPAF